MRTLYLDCGMGAAGDMLAGALLELIPDADAFLERMRKIGIPDVEIRREASVKCGVRGTHVHVSVHGIEESEELYKEAHAHDHDHGHDHGHDHDHPHSHQGLGGIGHLVRDHLDLPAQTAEDVMAVYRIIAEAEGKVHGALPEEIHFHEVGTMDAVTDIVMVCSLIRELAPEKVIASPVNAGGGEVRCAHGILPVPAPATALIMQDAVPFYESGIRSELCTPTGAALLRYFVDEFAPMPLMKVSAVGYGMGSKDFPRANCVRAMLGESGEDLQERMLILSCNVDDMTAEEIGFAMEELLASGAREVYTIPVGMKKNRQGTLIETICGEEERDAMVRRIFALTTTLGIREAPVTRHILDRETVTEETEFGPVRRKRAQGYGVSRSKLEYDDLARIAREHGCGIREARVMASHRRKK